jgi:hypothetical protein
MNEFSDQYAPFSGLESEHGSQTGLVFPTRVFDLKSVPHLNADEEEVLWLLIRGCSESRVRELLRLSPIDMRLRYAQIEDKLGVTNLQEAAALLEANGHKFEDHDRRILLENELSELIGARIIAPIYDDGFAGLRVVLAENQRIDLWFTTGPDNEIPGWISAENPPHPNSVTDFQSLRDRLTSGTNGLTNAALRTELSQIIEDAINWLDELALDADFEDAEIDEDTDFEPFEIPA